MGEKNISRALREVRLALLEADVNYQVVKEIIEATREDARGDKVLKSIKPGQQFIKLFHDKLVEFMTDPHPGLHLGGSPAVILLAGLQGSGKTTTAAKLARLLKKQGRSPLLVAADLRRPAAARQLETLGEKIQVGTFRGSGNCPLTIARNAIDYARLHDLNTVILDTSGRLHVDGELMAELKEMKEDVLGMEGYEEGRWVLIDSGEIVIHIFQETVREYYDLEGLWIDAPRLSLGQNAEKHPEEKVQA